MSFDKAEFVAHKDFVDWYTIEYFALQFTLKRNRLKTKLQGVSIQGVSIWWLGTQQSYRDKTWRNIYRRNVAECILQVWIANLGNLFVHNHNLLAKSKRREEFGNTV